MKNKNKLYFVHKTTNLKNGKFYIGVHETFNLNDGYLGSGKVLRNSIYFHGKENFKREILEFCKDKQTMYQKEKELVSEELVNDSNCMNLVPGGIGFINDEKHKIIAQKGGQSFAKKLKNDKAFFEKHSKLCSDRFKKLHKNGKIKYNTFEGKKHSDETKLKISNTLKNITLGENNSQFGTIWITNGKTNKKIKKYGEIPKDWYKGRII